MHSGTRKLSGAALQKCILLGAIEAQKTYEEITQVYWIGDYGVESFLNAYLAQHIKQWFPQTSVFMEARATDVSDALKTPRRGRPPAFERSKERIDLCILDAQGFPYSLIEVKRNFSNRVYAKDYNRLADRLRRYGRISGDNSRTLACGFLLFLIQESGIHLEAASERVRAKVKKARSEFMDGETVAASEIHTMPIDRWGHEEAFATCAVAVRMAPP